VVPRNPLYGRSFLVFRGLARVIGECHAAL
jgi:hypothetical protein